MPFVVCDRFFDYKGPKFDRIPHPLKIGWVTVTPFCLHSVSEYKAKFSVLNLHSPKRVWGVSLKPNRQLFFSSLYTQQLLIVLAALLLPWDLPQTPLYQPQEEGQRLCAIITRRAGWRNRKGATSGRRGKKECAMSERDGRFPLSVGISGQNTFVRTATKTLWVTASLQIVQNCFYLSQPNAWK